MLDVLIVALKATFKGHVKIILEVSEGRATFVVEDTRSGSSDGMRLLISRLFVEAMGGTMRADCPRSGNAFCIIELPLYQ